jgi:dihydrofolate reductase
MQIRTHIGVSLDGFVATPEGLPSWDLLPLFDADSHGYNDVMATCDAVIVGRTSFDQGFDEWMQGWPWPGKRVYVLTSRSLPSNVPEGVVAAKGGPTGVVEQLRADGITRDVQLLGGPRAIQAFLDAGELDRLGMVVLPFTMGRGIALFPTEQLAFSKEAWEASNGATPPKPPMLRLQSQRAFADGSLEIVYSGPST